MATMTKKISMSHEGGNIYMNYSVLSDISKYEQSDLVQRFINCLPPVFVNKDLLSHIQ